MIIIIYFYSWKTGENWKIKQEEEKKNKTQVKAEIWASPGKPGEIQK